MKYEEAMKSLEEITEKLEEGNLPLEEALQKFEEGMKLVSSCEKKLKEVEKRIQVLIKEKDTFRLQEWEAEESGKKVEEEERNEGLLEKEKGNKSEEGKPEEQNFLFPEEKK